MTEWFDILQEPTGKKNAEGPGKGSDVAEILNPN